MTKNATKRALLFSVLSLVLCMSMFVGTTYAWFTDSVTSANNKIIAGNRKVDLEMLDAETGDWSSIKDSQAPIFDYANWEPGYVDVKVLKVQNEGTLAFKWMAGLRANEELSDLANVIDVYVKPGVTAYPTTREEIADWDKAGTVAQFVESIQTTTYGTLEAGKEATLGIALKMQESAGNEYQGMALGMFDIMIIATQLTFEEDSFNDQYDAMATVDSSLKEAARIDGATERQVFWLITFPCVTPTLFYHLVTGLINAMQELNIMQVLATNGTGPDFAAVTLTYYMYRMTGASIMVDGFGMACAMGWVIALIIILITRIQFWLSKKWVSYD